MKQPARITLAGIAIATTGFLALPSITSGQAADDTQTIATLVAEIAQQQAKITENQKQMDEKLAAIAENLRVAKIYVSRGGGKTK